MDFSALRHEKEKIRLSITLFSSSSSSDSSWRGFSSFFFFFYFRGKFLLLMQEEKKTSDPWCILGVAAATPQMTRQLLPRHIMRSAPAAPGDTNEGATAPSALSSKSAPAAHVLFISLIMAVLRSRLKGITIVPGTAHHIAVPTLTGVRWGLGTDEAGRRIGAGTQHGSSISQLPSGEYQAALTR